MMLRSGWTCAGLALALQPSLGNNLRAPGQAADALAPFSRLPGFKSSHPARTLWLHRYQYRFLRCIASHEKVAWWQVGVLLHKPTRVQRMVSVLCPGVALLGHWRACKIYFWEAMSVVSFDEPSPALPLGNSRMWPPDQAGCATSVQRAAERRPRATRRCIEQ
jgi:hypothetical protein